MGDNLRRYRAMSPPPSYKGILASPQGKHGEVGETRCTPVECPYPPPLVVEHVTVHRQASAGEYVQIEIPIAVGRVPPPLVHRRGPHAWLDADRGAGRTTVPIH